jgi:predicted dehydrogenase
MYLAGLWNPTSVSARTYARFGRPMREYRYVGMWAGPPNFDGVFDVEDYAAGFVRFGAKATMSFEVAWAANSQGEAFVELLGDKAGVRLLNDKPLTLLTEHGGRVADISPQFGTGGNSFETQAAKFMAACRGESPPAATGEQGVTVMKLIDAIYNSSRKGKEVAIR